jgi:hypothetical protein
MKEFLQNHGRNGYIRYRQGTPLILYLCNFYKSSFNRYMLRKKHLISQNQGHFLRKAFFFHWVSVDLGICIYHFNDENIFTMNLRVFQFFNSKQPNQFYSFYFYGSYRNITSFFGKVLVIEMICKVQQTDSSYSEWKGG